MSKNGLQKVAEGKNKHQKIYKRNKEIWKNYVKKKERKQIEQNRNAN